MELENVNNFSLKFRTLNSEFSYHNFANLSKILDFDRNNSYTHFCFSELLILREKRFADFLLGN